MLAGQLMAHGINFFIQVLVVRALTTQAYGSFAWALAVVTLVQAILPLGIDRASARFLALYDERRDYPRLFGLLAIEAIVLVGLGTLVVVAVQVLASPITSTAPSHDAVAVLLILIALAPVQAIDIIVVEMFAVFGSPWSVFLRRFVLEPILRLTVVLLLVLGDRGTSFLAAGYVLAAAAGLVVYLGLLVRLFKRIGLAPHFQPRKVVLPWGEVARFCGPMLLSSLVAVATTEFAAIFVGLSSGADAVATFRAVQPFAALNLVVLYSFTTLFTPAASRLAARRSHGEVSDLYWLTAAWVVVLTFPVFAVTTAFASQFTVFTLGERYSSSATVLVILSVGYYLNAALGFNGITTQILGRNWWVLVTSLATLATAVASLMILAPRFQAVGAAIAVLVTLIVNNVLKQAGLGFGLGIGIWRRQHASLVLKVSVVLLALVLVNRLVPVSLLWAFPMVLVAWVVVLRSTRSALKFGDAFPEIRRIPFLRWVMT
jgi:O-antigen/teichoic acid export membrane protein